MMWILGVTMSKCLSDGKVEFGHIVAHHISATEGEARTWFLRAIQQARPGFAVNEMSCSEIPAGELRRGLKKIKRPAASSLQGLH